MTLDDIEKLARLALTNARLHAYEEEQLARAFLDVLPVVRAALDWRNGVIEVGSRLLDSDDGNAEQGMSRPPAVRVLVDAIDHLRSRLGVE